jgi:hypothetical protein
MVSSTLFIDPIPFLLHLPTVAFNFVYRKPRTANEWQLWYFASRDADVSRALSRYFFWTENVLWKEELEGRRVGVVLSGEDQIVNSEEVRRYLTGEQDMTGEREICRKWEKDGTEDRRKPMLDVMHRFVRL